MLQSLCFGYGMREAQWNLRVNEGAMETVLWVWEELGGGSTQFQANEGVVETVLLMRESQQNFQVNEGVIQTVVWVWEEDGSTKSVLLIVCVGFFFSLTYFVSCNGSCAPKEKWHRKEHFFFIIIVKI